MENPVILSINIRAPAKPVISRYSNFKVTSDQSMDLLLITEH